jgi:hypothetical protein
MGIILGVATKRKMVRAGAVLKPVAVSELMKFVDQGLQATTQSQAAAIEGQFLAGYYGRTIERPRAKASRVVPLRSDWLPYTRGKGGFAVWYA